MKKFVVTIILLLTTFCSNAKKYAPIVLIDPAGHARDLGRLIVEGYERAETLKFARALKQRLLDKYRVRPVISRSPGEEISHLQVASFANRLKADFVLRIHLYREETEKQKLFFYHLLYNHIVDCSAHNFEPLSLISLDQAHFNNIHVTKLWGTKMYNYLNQSSFRRFFDCFPLRGIPLKALVGITAPAILLEVGICAEGRWKNLIEPIVDSLSFLGEIH